MRNWKKRTRTIDDNEFLRWGERTKRKRTIFRTRIKTGAGAQKPSCKERSAQEARGEEQYNTNDQSTSFGSEYDMTTATQTLLPASREAVREGQGQGGSM
eukprot:scaffold5533_cov111-Skeletonema_dohrnii-CCMP3373.AAC.6